MGASSTELLIRALGRDRVIGQGEDGYHAFCRDESGFTGEPDAVALPRSSAEVAAVLELAAAESLPVIPRGAGSGKTGGCVATRGGIVVSTERMQTIVEVDAGDLVAVVEPGVLTADVAAAADAEGLYYPPDPASLAYSSIGGNIASNAGGPSAFKYGVTGHYVLGLEVGLIGGETVRLGRRTSKGVSGYDLSSAWVGSEGTFGVITRATLRLIPAPREKATLLATFGSRAAAGQAVTEVVTSGLWPRTLELIDSRTLDIVRAHSARPLPIRAGAALLIEIDGDDALAAVERCGDVLSRARADEILVARDASHARDLWEARRGISPALKARYPHKVSEDICVPRSRMPAMLDRIDGIGARFGIEMAAYGHAGDGNLHVNFLFAEARDAALEANLQGAIQALFEATVELGGTLSGEHGIGLAKRDFMAIEHPPAALDWQRRLKALWDPRGLMNPGKVLAPPRP